MTFSAQLRRAIAASGQSQNALAEASGVRQSRISDFLAGKSITLDTAEKLAAAIGAKLVVTRRRKAYKKRPRHAAHYADPARQVKAATPRIALASGP